MSAGFGTALKTTQVRPDVSTGDQMRYICRVPQRLTLTDVGRVQRDWVGSCLAASEPARYSVTTGYLILSPRRAKYPDVSRLRHGYLLKKAMAGMFHHCPVTHEMNSEARSLSWPALRPASQNKDVAS